MAVHTQAASSLTGVSTRRWNYQDKHQLAGRPALTFLVGPTPAPVPPPAHLCTFSPRLHNSQTAAFITDPGSVTAGIIFTMKSPAFMVGCWSSTRRCTISSHNHSRSFVSVWRKQQVFLVFKYNPSVYVQVVFEHQKHLNWGPTLPGQKVL